MWIQVRSFDGKKSIRVDGLSKLTKIEELRERLVDKFDAPPDRQRLFFRGKQLVDGHSLFDYHVGLNEIVQIMVRSVPPPCAVEDKSEEESKPESGFCSEVSDSEQSGSGSYNGEVAMVTEGPSSSGEVNKLRGQYKVGDIVDAMDISMGAWFEATITNISIATPKIDEEPSGIVDQNQNEQTERNGASSKENDEKETKKEKDEDVSQEKECRVNEDGKEIPEESLIYHVRFEGYDDNEVADLSSKYMRPRARTILKWEEMKVGDVVMANYNSDDPNERGFWYDFEIKSMKSRRTCNELIGNVLLGPAGDALQDCKIKLTDEIYKIEKYGEVSVELEDASSVRRSNQPECNHCKDNPDRKCKQCACHNCGGKDDPDKQLMCDECDMAYHLYCLDPPLAELPDVEEWYCPLCKNDASEVVQAGQKLKESKKKAKMASSKSSCKRDWGKGMACVGRSKICTIVPPNHFGEIPGVHIGTLWKFRVQVSEAGVHRPHVAGIHGRETEGAYSIVLAGGYEDDEDNGEEFTYTGSGGRDLSGNKRTAEQSCDQELTKMNQALARNCNCPLDKVNGGSAKDWRSGKSVRVVRSCKGRKHSKYAPEDGCRYDGIYKIVQYWPEKGKSGFRVWRFLLRRDDENPAPWTKSGKKLIKEHGLSIQYPEGYLEAMAAKEKEKELKKKGKSKDTDEDTKPTTPKGKRKKNESETSSTGTPAKKKKTERSAITAEMKKKIKEDEENSKSWSDVVEQVKNGKTFLSTVEEVFMCVCCQELVYQPITTPCKHNVCKACLQRSFRAQVYNCPACRYDLGKGYSMAQSKVLASILRELFPGYENGR
ncbi:E3 ubiquitin-protein ligase UHRF1-like [Anneissia japonica]|uniref:E3 ubiquitin-protein ligase UHRF1-like n=1 Tax=Anneissia japonica TaxID=1529436 RepID=UPI001425B367|nr:E3 ubiquitin-protein ligase UHRF1-like [Anneissia japonica]